MIEPAKCLQGVYSHFATRAEAEAEVERRALFYMNKTGNEMLYRLAKSSYEIKRVIVYSFR